MITGQFQTLAVIVNLEAQSKLNSLFQVFAHSSLSYAGTWNYLQELERNGLVIVERSGSGIPLKIASTEAGRKMVSECAWKLVLLEPV